MNTAPRLDRLSALLAGLAPRVEVAQSPAGLSNLKVDADPVPFLHLHLLTAGQIRLQIEAGGSLLVDTPSIVVCRSDTAHSLAALSADAFQHLMCARAFFDGPVAALLLNEFREPVVVSLDGEESSLAHVVKLISLELLAPRCGQPALLERAGDILFIGLLRHLIAHPKTAGGLLRGLADPRISRALVAIHKKPDGKWTLESLAEAAGMSRTSFANTFREVMNQTPGKYLAKVRLAIAQRAVQSGRGLKAAARDSGYTNSSALSRALSRQAAGASLSGVSEGN